MKKDGNGEVRSRRGRPAGSTARVTILEGAAQAFAESGFHDCTVASILSASTVSRTNFYRFFDNKEQVFEALLDQRFDYLDKQMQQAFADTKAIRSNEEKIDHVSMIYLQACFDAGPLLRVLLQETFTVPEHQRLREHTLARFRRGISTLIMQAGYRKPDPLLLEAILAGIERIVLVTSKRKASSSEKFRIAYDRIRTLVRAISKEFEVT